MISSLIMIPSPFTLLISVLFIFLTIAIVIVRFRLKFHALRLKSTSPSSDKISIAFFHPHCRGGGGGERVLWKAIESISQMNQDGYDSDKKDTSEEKNGSKCYKLRVVIYTSDQKDRDYHQGVLNHVKDRFSIIIPESLDITFIHIPPMTLLTKQRFTLIMESLNSIKLAYNALCQFTPHVYIDTTGCAFTFVVAKLLANCKVIAYVHYPTISTDMLNLVWERRPTYNNTSSISKNKLFTALKLVYYIVFAILYGLVGSLSDIILVNSTWTYNHITYLWRYHGFFTMSRNKTRKINVVYPPCDISTVDDDNNNISAKKGKRRENCIVSIGQFRPEKDHAKQIKSFAKLISTSCIDENSNKTLLPSNVKLLLIGSCRNESDYSRVDQLRTLAYDTLALPASKVEFIINEPYPVLQKYMSTSLIGLHTMWNEHFGISIVEMMSNGLITIGHNSGGPKSDIITVPQTSNHQDAEVQRTGYLAHTEEEYVQAFRDILSLNEDEKNKIRDAAKISCERFSDDVFMHEFKFFLLKVI